MSEIGQKIIAAVRAKAVANPAFVYKPVSDDDEGGQTCLYVKDGCPSCIVGHGLWDTGLIDASIEEKFANRAPFNDWNKNLFPVICELDEVELIWLNDVQREQDGGTAWGIAVQSADEMLPAA